MKINTQAFKVYKSHIYEKVPLLAENQKLSKLRDWLLPMLRNGQLTIEIVDENELNIAAEKKEGYGKR